MKVGLLLIATGKYDMFLPALLQSVGRYFLPDHDVHTCIFTDKRFTSSDKTQIFPIEHRPWPMTTLFRYKIFHQHVH